MHGGKTPGGIASPHWKHGRYSKYMPAGVLDKYEGALADRELLALTDEIALARARLFQLLERVQTYDASDHWKNIAAYVEVLVVGLRKSDPDKINDSMRGIQAIVSGARGDYATWGEIADVAERIRRLSDSESRRRKDMQLMIQADDATNFVVAVATLAREYVPEGLRLEFHDKLMGLMRRSGVNDPAQSERG